MSKNINSGNSSQGSSGNYVGKKNKGTVSQKATPTVTPTVSPTVNLKPV